MNSPAAVVKIGGSVIRSPEALKGVLARIISLSRKGYGVTVIPGGGEAAELVRKKQETLSLSDTAAHWMAVRAMDINGVLISDLNSGFTIAEDISSCRAALEEKKVPVFLSSSFLRQEGKLPESWDVTSDSISLFIASKLGVSRLVLVKDVEGVYPGDGAPEIIETLTPEDLREIRRKTSSGCVDRYFPSLASETGISTCIVSGYHPGRVEDAVTGRDFEGTLVRT